MKKTFAISTTIVLILIVGAAGFVWFGGYDIAADDPHWPITFKLMQTVRDRSIAVRAEHLSVPDLNDPQVILKGAGQYAAMCTGCHLAPGMHDSEIRPGLYPQPPNLSRHAVDPKVAFWAIKHGIKMSAMPAWGFSHDDATIWSMVAFLQKLPGMTPAQYKDIVAKAPPDEDMDMGGSHDHGEARDHDDEVSPAPAMSAMPGMKSEQKGSGGR
jgi:mono/diheme cytochrome c family protein